MDFIYKKNNLSFSLSYLINNSFESFFKLAFIFSSSNQSSHVQRIYLFTFQIFRDITTYNSMSQTFCYGSLTSTRLSY